MTRVDGEGWPRRWALEDYRVKIFNATRRTHAKFRLAEEEPSVAAR